jgi:hypothetical protein
MSCGARGGHIRQPKTIGLEPIPTEEGTMTKLTFDISMSLDGFTAGPNQTLDEPLGRGGEGLHEWALALKSWREPHGRRVSLTIKATEDDLHTLQRALTGLRDVVKPGPMRIELSVTAEDPEDAIDAVQFQNRVRQHLEEDEDVSFEERWE